MGLSPILPEIQPVIIDTMVNNNGPLLNIRLNFVMCERSLIRSELILCNNVCVAIDTMLNFDGDVNANDKCEQAFT